MATIKNPLARASPLSCLRTVRSSTPLKSSLATIQPILPDIVSTNLLQKHRTKKRVRFALKLEPIQEDSSLPPDYENPAEPPVKTSKQTNDPWREDGPLYGSYVEYLERKNTSPPESPVTTRPTRPLPPEPAVEISTYAQTFLIQNKSTDLLVDSITMSTPTHQLPRIVQRPMSTKKTNRKPSSPVIDCYSKQRVNITTPPRYTQSRKIPNSSNNRNQSNLVNPSIKRADLALPLIKTFNSNEKLNQTDCPLPLGTKVVNDYLQSKKLTEIITNPLPGTNNPINHIPGHTILPNLSKTPSISCHNQLTTEPYFFQNHNHDHYQPVIHSTH